MCAGDIEMRSSVQSKVEEEAKVLRRVRSEVEDCRWDLVCRLDEFGCEEGGRGEVGYV